MIDALEHAAAALASQPAAVALLLLAATLIVEDAATIAAGLLSAAATVDPALSLAAVIAGTVIGDIGLYAVGHVIAGSRTGERLAARQDVGRAAVWLNRHQVQAVLAARVTPGLRFPVFLASGLGRAPFPQFAMLVVASVPPWTGLLFYASLTAGEAGAAMLGAWSAPLALVSLATIVLLPRHRKEPVQ